MRVGLPNAFTISWTDGRDSSLSPLHFTNVAVI